MKKLILSLALLIAISGCQEKKIPGIIIETDLNLLVTDRTGANLLQNGKFKQEEIILSNIVNGEKQVVFSPNLDYPRNFFIYDFENPGTYKGQKLIRIFPNLVDKGPVTTTLIQWNETDIDTIKTEIDRVNSSSTFVASVWINDELKWNYQIGKEQYGSGEMTTLSRFIKLVK